MPHLPLTTLVAIFALLVYVGLSFTVGRARARHGVIAPSTEGPPEFMRAMRVQMNTLEQLIVFLPALWMFAALWGDRPAALIGIFWPLARLHYARAYLAAPESRGPGFIVALLASMILLLGAGFRAVERLI